MTMKKPTEKQINKAMNVLKEAGYIQQYWHIEDIIERDAENTYGEDETSDLPRLSEEKALKIARLIERTHDANIGINWEVIDQAIEEAQQCTYTIRS
jgi:hypothetical protein